MPDTKPAGNISVNDSVRRTCSRLRTIDALGSANSCRSVAHDAGARGNDRIAGCVLGSRLRERFVTVGPHEALRFGRLDKEPPVVSCCEHERVLQVDNLLTDQRSATPSRPCWLHVERASQPAHAQVDRILWVQRLPGFIRYLRLIRPSCPARRPDHSRRIARADCTTRLYEKRLSDTGCRARGRVVKTGYREM